MKNNLQTHRRLLVSGLRWALVLPVLFCTLAAFSTPSTKYVTPGGAGNKNGSSWANAYDSVAFRSALRSAASGTVFWVATGTYKPANNRDSAFVIPSGVKVYGGFVGNETLLSQRNDNANVTVLSGDIGKPVVNSDNCYNIVRFVNVSTATILDGFTISHGNASASSGNVNQYSGGGIYIHCTSISNVCSPAILNCMFMYDSAYTQGGAIYIDGYDGTCAPTITNCIFSHNAADAGAAIEDDDGSLAVTNCLFVNNNSFSYGCVFTESDHHNITTTITNCTFSGNTANTGAAVYNVESAPYTCSVTLNNCILWNDVASSTANELYDNGTTSTLHNCDIKGGWSGTGSSNINSDPRFIGDPDYRLQPGSPCINVGNNSYVISGITTDLAGSLRIQNGTVDMGAYEGGICVPMTNVTVTPSVVTICSSNSQRFTLNNVRDNANIQWQYGLDPKGNVSTWTNFGTTNKDTATLSSISATTYIRAIVGNSCTKDIASTDAIVYMGSVSRLTLSGITNAGATATWTPVIGALNYRVFVNGSSVAKITGTTYTITGLTACTLDSVYVKPNISTCSGNAVNSNVVHFNTSTTPLTLGLTTSSNTVKASWSGGTGPYKLYISYTTNPNNYIVYSVTGSSYTLPYVTGGNTMIAFVIDQGSTCAPKAQSGYVYYNVPGTVCVSTAPSITGKSATATSISYNWTGAATGYQVYYKKLTDIAWNGYYTTGNSYSANGLSPNTCYEVLIANRCSVSPAQLGYSTKADTICTAGSCPAPINLVISNITCHGFTATWSAVNNAIDYSAYFTRTTGVGAPITYAYRYAQNVLTINSLPSGYGYSVYVQANCTNGARTGASNTENLITSTVGCKDGNNGSTIDNAASSFNVYPNPNNGQFIINLTTPNTTANATVQIINSIGRVVDQQVVSNNNGLIHAQLNYNSMAAGMYVVRVILGNETHTARIIVQK